MSDRALPMWTIYDHPPQFPNNYVAREWIVDGDNVPRASSRMLVCPDLEQIRAYLREHGKVQLSRNDIDDPTIIETWI